MNNFTVAFVFCLSCSVFIGVVEGRGSNYSSPSPSPSPSPSLLTSLYNVGEGLVSKTLPYMTAASIYSTNLTDSTNSTNSTDLTNSTTVLPYLANSTTVLPSSTRLPPDPAGGGYSLRDVLSVGAGGVGVTMITLPIGAALINRFTDRAASKFVDWMSGYRSSDSASEKQSLRKNFASYDATGNNLVTTQQEI